MKAFTDAAADAIGREIASLRREAERERVLREAEHRARMAEIETRLLAAAEVERHVRDRLDGLKDGVPGSDGIDGKDGEQGRDGRDGHDVADIEVTQDGRTIEFGFTVGERREIFEVELPEGPAGKDGERGPEGMFPAAKAWVDEVCYEGAVRTHLGATWQALCDTGREPGSGDDWGCLAAAGTDGKDGLSLTPRGLWLAETNYQRNDVVALNGGSFAAVTDAPGECPGPGWKLLAQQGKRGDRGEKGPKGERGERGEPGMPVVAMTIDGEGMLTLVNGDGSQVQCDLYPVLAKLGGG